MLTRGILVAIALLGVLAPSADARGLRLGFLDGVYTEPAPVREPWLDRTVSSGSNIVRISSGWGGIAPTKPRDPADPADPAYNWTSLDNAVKAARRRNLDVIVSLTGAPEWAEGRRRPPGAGPGSWRPNARAFGVFARALARRYSGRYPDPQRPGMDLPKVTTYLPWNEPNLDYYLSPQWTRSRGRFIPASPGIYRGLLNSFARGVKTIDRRNRVVAGATAPFGDPPGGRRFPPARFVRSLLSRRTVFDVLSHHPYSVRGPRARAFARDDVSVSDMKKLSGPLSRAQRAGRIAPRGRKRLWVTEFAWDSSPPDPFGVPEARQARWLQESFYILWRDGVDTITWFQIRDQAPSPSFALSSQSGVYFRNGRPKLAQRGFAFPFVVIRGRANRLKAWSRAPAAGTLAIERRTRRGWRPVRRVGVARQQVVLRPLPSAPRGTRFRARLGTLTSLAWRS